MQDLKFSDTVLKIFCIFFLQENFSGLLNFSALILVNLHSCSQWHIKVDGCGLDKKEELTVRFSSMQIVIVLEGNKSCLMLGVF